MLHLFYFASTHPALVIPALFRHGMRHAIHATQSVGLNDEDSTFFALAQSEKCVANTEIVQFTNGNILSFYYITNLKTSIH
jgi:hypothetical protein